MDARQDEGARAHRPRRHSLKRCAFYRAAAFVLPRPSWPCMQRPRIGGVDACLIDPPRQVIPALGPTYAGPLHFSGPLRPSPVLPEQPTCASARVAWPGAAAECNAAASATDQRTHCPQRQECAADPHLTSRCTCRCPPSCLGRQAERPRRPVRSGRSALPLLGQCAGRLDQLGLHRLNRAAFQGGKALTLQCALIRSDRENGEG